MSVYFIVYSYILFYSFVFFFFKQKTAYEMRISDWSSDVCSSDLAAARPGVDHLVILFLLGDQAVLILLLIILHERARLLDQRLLGGGDNHVVQIGRASCRERVCQYV